MCPLSLRQMAKGMSEVSRSKESSGEAAGFAEEAAPSFTELPTLLDRQVENTVAGRGADTTFLDTLLSHGFSREELFELVVPRRTFARRLQTGRLSLEESDRAVRLARLTAMAERVFGDFEKAHRWLRKPSPMLDGAVPVALLKSESGAHLLEQTLHRIDYGMFA